MEVTGAVKEVTGEETISTTRSITISTTATATILTTVATKYMTITTNLSIEDVNLYFYPVIILVVHLYHQSSQEIVICRYAIIWHDSILCYH